MNRIFLNTPLPYISLRFFAIFNHFVIRWLDWLVHALLYVLKGIHELIFKFSERKINKIEWWTIYIIRQRTSKACTMIIIHNNVLVRSYVREITWSTLFACLFRDIFHLLKFIMYLWLPIVYTTLWSRVCLWKHMKLMNLHNITYEHHPSGRAHQTSSL